MSNLVKEAMKATTGKGARVSYGIVLHVGNAELNEWGLTENQAKEINELLTINGDQAIGPDDDGITYSRRPPSTVSNNIAKLRAKLKPVTV